jgi:hypothetical protein
MIVPKITNLILTNILMIWGFSVFCYQAYQLVRRRPGTNRLLWLSAGLITVVGTILVSTLFVYLARSGYEQMMSYFKNAVYFVIVATWIYVAHQEGFFQKNSQQ